MGCCALCESTPGEAKPLFPRDGSLQHLNTLRYDPYALEMQRYFHELRNSPGWTVNAELPEVTIKSLPRSDFSERAPVFYLILKPIPNVDFSLLVKLLLEPDYRLSWDNTLTDYRELPSEAHKLYYSMYELPFPFKNRDFVETATVIPSPSGMHLVKYSTEECELRTNMERATTHFFVASAELTDEATEIVVMGQIDLNLPFKQQLLMRYAGDLFEDWVHSFIKALSN